MPAILTPYLMFDGGTARDAMTFYQSVFGGDLQIMSYADMGGMGLPEEVQQQVMHAALTAGDGVCFMASDLAHEPTEHPNSPVALSGDDETVLTGWWTALCEGGTVCVDGECVPNPVNCENGSFFVGRGEESTSSV